MSGCFFCYVEDIGEEDGPWMAIRAKMWPGECKIEPVWQRVAEKLDSKKNRTRYDQFSLEAILRFCRCSHAKDISERVFKSLLELCGGGLSESVCEEEEWCVTLSPNQFFSVVQRCIVELHLEASLDLFGVSCDVSHKRHWFAVLLGGTSGTGKSTLASAVARSMGLVNNVIGTNTLREVCRKLKSEKEAPFLWASSYHAGEALVGSEYSHMSEEEKVVTGYNYQADFMLELVEDVIVNAQAKGDLLVMEGVHLTVENMKKLCQRHPSCIPFVISIPSEAKHKHRLATRGENLTLDPKLNKYSKYFKNIRIIHDHLLKEAKKKQVSVIQNNDIYRSISTIHETVLACLQEVSENPSEKLCSISPRVFERIKEQNSRMGQPAT